MSAEPCAIVGIGQTKHKTRREDVSQAGLLREAADRALDDAEHDLDGHRHRRHRQGARRLRGRHDAGALPGRRPRCRRQADDAGAHRRLASVARPASSPRTWCSNRIHERVLAVAYEKQSEGNAQWGLGGGKSGGMGAGGIFAPWIRAYIERSRRARAHRLEGRRQGPAERAEEPVRPPAAEGHHHRQGPRVADAVGPAALPGVLPVLGRRLRDRLHRRGRWQRAQAAGRTPGVGPVDRRCAASRPRSRGRDPVRPQAGVRLRGRRLRGRPASPTRREQIDVAELYVPFSWYEPMWLEGHDIAADRRGLEDDRLGRHRDRRLASRSTRPAACSRPTRSAPPA